MTGNRSPARCVASTLRSAASSGTGVPSTETNWSPPLSAVAFGESADTESTPRPFGIAQFARGRLDGVLLGHQEVLGVLARPAPAARFPAGTGCRAAPRPRRGAASPGPRPRMVVFSVSGRHRHQVQVPGRRGHRVAADRDDVLAVVLAQGVERGPGALDQVRHAHAEAQDAQHQAQHGTDEQGAQLTRHCDHSSRRVPAWRQNPRGRLSDPPAGRTGSADRWAQRPGWQQASGRAGSVGGRLVGSRLKRAGSPRRTDRGMLRECPQQRLVFGNRIRTAQPAVRAGGIAPPDHDSADSGAGHRSQQPPQPCHAVHVRRPDRDDCGRAPEHARTVAAAGPAGWVGWLGRLAGSAGWAPTGGRRSLTAHPARAPAPRLGRWKIP